MKRWLACLLAVLMAIVLVVPALGQEMGEENVLAEVDLSAEAEVESYEMMAEEETDEGEPLEADTVVEPAPLIPPVEEEAVSGDSVVMEAEDTSVEADEVSLSYALDVPMVAEDDNEGSPSSENEETTNVYVEIRWNDASYMSLYRPQCVGIHLLANGVVIDDGLIDAENDWQYCWANLPVFDSEGKTIRYDINAEDCEYYEKAIYSKNSTNDIIAISCIYYVKRGSIRITKHVTINGYATTSTQADGIYTFEINNDNGYKGVVQIEIKNGAGKTISIKDLFVGEYTVTEIVPAGMTVNAESQVVNVLPEGEGETATVTFINNIDCTPTPSPTPIPTPPPTTRPPSTPVPTPALYISRAASLTLKKDAKKTVGPGDVLVVVPGSAAKSVKSSRTAVATAKLSGGLINVMTKAEGKAVITVTLKNGKALKLTLTVVDPTIPKSITLNKTKATVYLGQTLRLKHTLKPATAWDYVKWMSTNAKVAKVDASGLVTPVKAGKAYVVAMAQRGKISAVATITVKDPNQPNGVALAPEKKSIYLGETLDLNGWVTVTYPKPALVTTPATLTWKSSNKKVAKVSAKGLVTPVKTGSVTVTAASANGKTAACKVTVKDPNLPKSVAFSTEKASVRLGGKLALASMLTCTYAKPALVTAAPTLTWKSSDATIAKVSKSGVVIPVKAGRATITATTANGKRAAIVVTVKK